MDRDHGEVEGDEEEEYLDDDDFESFGGGNHIDTTKLRQSPIIKPKNQQQQHVEQGGDEDDENIFDDEDIHNEPNPIDEDEEGQDGPNFEQESMTLESYMEEFFKRKYQEPNPDATDKSPEAVDPQGLDGVSPGPGQRHINGTDSPFHFEMDCFTPRSPKFGNPSESRTALANILTKVQDVQSTLIEISTKVDSTTTAISISPKSSTKKKGSKKSSPTEEHLSPTQDAKIEILKKELQKKTQELRDQKEFSETLQRTITDQASHIHLLEDDLKEERARCTKAIKQKNKALQTLQKMSQELEKYTTVLNVMNEMKTREELLHAKIKELTLQNHDLTAQLKGSMARELEWRTLLHSEQSRPIHHPLGSHADSSTNQSSRLASHRSLPDNESDHLPKVQYERKSHTERREKKNKNSAKNLPKIPKKKSEY